MALKNLFDMVKADKYTADGREAIIKAQEAATEDARRTYQIGEISEATGLQKTANGWKPPKETKFGKVTQNKEGQWGVQTKLGKGSDFIKHKDENEAKRALSDYTRGYNRTASTRPDPHSDYARQQKQWNKETDRMRKASNAERRAEHASHFQENKPAAKKPDGVDEEGNIKIPKAGMNVLVKVNGNRPGKIVSSRGDYVEVEMPARGAYPGRRDTYYKSDLKFDEEMKADALERSDAESKPDGAAGAKNENKPKSYNDKEGNRNHRQAMIENPKDAYDFEKTVIHSIPMSAGDKEQLANIKSFMRDEHTDYKDAIKSVATGLINGNKMRGDWYPEKEKSVLKIAKAVGLEDELKNYVTANFKNYEFGYSEDSAPRVLTGDTKIRVRKA